MALTSCYRLQQQVPAPPLAARLLTASADIKETQKDYYHTLRDVCAIGSEGCRAPGYLVQWPYVDNGLGEAAFPKALSRACVRVAGGEDGYVWDYFSSQLLLERFVCNSTEVPFVEAGTAFHFRTDWYQQAHTVTMRCARQLLEEQHQEGDQEMEVLSESAMAVFNDGEMRAQMERCFLNDEVWQSFNRGGLCDCKTTNVVWTMDQFRANEGLEGAVGGSDGSNQKGRVSLRQHNMYGCFFASPIASAPVSASYDVCGSLPSPKIQVGPYSQAILQAEAKRAERRGGASRKTALLTFFLLKEAGPIGAFAALLVLSLLCACVYPLGLLIVQLLPVVCCCEPVTRTHFKAAVWVGIESAWGELVNVIWQLSIGMSNCFRGWSTLREVLFSSQVNASLVKDGINKITAVLNIMFNLMVLVLSDVTFSDNGALWFSIMLSAFTVVIQILMEKERQKFITAFFKDVNENRLGKFELALGLVKCMEDFLEDDVNFNFVQHMYGDEGLRPPEADDYEQLEKDKPGEYYKIWSIPDEDEERRLSNGKVRNVLCCGDVQDYTNPTIFPFYPLLPDDLVKKFGHDGKFEFDKRYQTGEAEAPGLAWLQEADTSEVGVTAEIGTPTLQTPVEETGLEIEMSLSQVDEASAQSGWA